MLHNQTIDTIKFLDGTKISGYVGEYVFEKIRSTNEFYENELLERWVLPNAEKFKVIYDIGANIGNHTVYFATRTKAKVFPFEPYEPNYALLIKNIEENQLSGVTPYNVALGRRSGKASMSIIQETNLGSATIISMEDNDNSDLPIELVKLDSLNLPKPDLIKIDVEGYEENVLLGMKEILINSSPMIWIEISEKNTDSVFQNLSSLGYSIVDMELAVGNNFLFTKDCANQNDYAKLLRQTLDICEKYRSLYRVSSSLQSKFEFEQKKAEELKVNLEKMTSHYIFEQKKAEELKANLEKMTSHYIFEQKKRRS